MLKPYFETLDEKVENFRITHSRERRFLDWAISSFPEDIEARYSVAPLDKTLLRCFVYLRPEISDADMHRTTKWLLGFSENNERFFRDNEGKFAWKAELSDQDEYGKYRIMLFLENIPSGNCTIRKVKKEVEVYESECK